MLDFQHIIQVNDLEDKNLLVITRSQLWQGLVLRARNPEKFNAALQCESSDEEENKFIRRISAGEAIFEELVVMTPELKIETSTTPEIEQIFAESCAVIEEAELNSLFVRFSYSRDLDARENGVQIAEYLKSAYVQLDRDAIAMIRILAQSESLNTLVN
ncbi:MAG: hypothetical protein ACJA2Q_001998 [Pseudohongiellaceae bacterium]